MPIDFGPVILIFMGSKAKNVKFGFWSINSKYFRAINLKHCADAFPESGWMPIIFGSAFLNILITEGKKVKTHFRYHNSMTWNYQPECLVHTLVLIPER